MNKEDHLKDRSRVYSYGIDLKKNIPERRKRTCRRPDKVQFSLKNSSDEHYITANDAPGVYLRNRVMLPKGEEKRYSI